MNNKEITFTDIYNSKLYREDKDFLIDFLRDEKCYSYDEVIEIIKDEDRVNRLLTSEELEKIEENKDTYYQWDFWDNTEYLQDNRSMIRWNFYWDKENNEIIINSWVELEYEDWEYITISDITYDVYEFNTLLYKKVFKAFCLNDYSSVVETDYVDIVWDWSWNSKYTNLNKPDFVIKYRWWQGYTYSIYEYDLI